MIFANKSDITAPEEVQVTDEEINEYSKTKGIPIIKTSARTGEGVDDSFLDMTKQLILKKNQAGGSSDDRKRNMGLAFKKLQLSKEATSS
jgi:signal recognition particle receptor subunit beta